MEELLRQRFRNEFTFTTTEPAPSAAHDGLHSDEEETELQLFAAPSNAAPQTFKIKLSSPGRGNIEPSMIVKKPRSYYFAAHPTPTEQAALHASAIDGQTVAELARTPWPGCALPWKVRSISAAGLTAAVLAGHARRLGTGDEKARKRTRKSKKTRIAIRRKTVALKTKAQQREVEAKQKEDAEREKRTRRNREKKVKRKERERAKKAGEGGDGDV